MTELVGGSDPARSLALLWRTGEKTSRKGKPDLSVDRIVHAAIDIADRAGLDAVSMRKVAEELGVGTMSLYTYIPGKGELYDVMVDAALGETQRDEPQQQAKDWRTAVTDVAERNWQLYLRHPWLLAAPTSRNGLGPHVIAKYDRELAAVDGIGLTEIEMDSVLTLVLNHVRGAAQTHAEMRQIERRTGMSDDQWWTVHAPLLERVFDPTRFPLAAKVGQAAGEAHQATADPRHAFEFGLQRVLDGIETLVESRR